VDRIAVLADVGWGIGLAGVGVIALATQGARKYFGLPVAWFGLVIGVVFAVWSLSELLNIDLGRTRMSGSLLPIVCIVVGLLLVVLALRCPRRA
jgi:hypothetical protein